MSCQIIFYLDNVTQDKLINEIYELGYELINCKVLNEKIVIYNQNDQLNFNKGIFYISNKKYSNKMYIREWGQIDPRKSYVIEYIPTNIQHNNKQIIKGRLWMEKTYFENSKEIKKDIELYNIYSHLKKWIQQHTCYQKINNCKYYISNEIFELINKGYIIL